MYHLTPWNPATHVWPGLSYPCTNHQKTNFRKIDSGGKGCVVLARGLLKWIPCALGMWQSIMGDGRLGNFSVQRCPVSVFFKGLFVIAKNFPYLSKLWSCLSFSTIKLQITWITEGIWSLGTGFSSQLWVEWSCSGHISSSVRWRWWIVESLKGMDTICKRKKMGLAWNSCLINDGW